MVASKGVRQQRSRILMGGHTHGWATGHPPLLNTVPWAPCLQPAPAPHGLPAVPATLAASCGCCRHGLTAQNRAAKRPACSPEAGQEHLDAWRPRGCQLRHLDAADWRRQAAPLRAPPLAAAQQPPQARAAPPRWLAVAQLHYGGGAAGARSAGARCTAATVAACVRQVPPAATAAATACLLPGVAVLPPAQAAAALLRTCTPLQRR